MNKKEFKPSAKDAARILESRKLIDEEGKHRVQVLSVRRYADKMIINLKAMNPYHQEMARRYFREGDYIKALNQNMTTNARVNPDGSYKDYVPSFNPENGSSGEFIDINVSTRMLNDGAGGKTPGLVIVSHEPVPVKTEHETFSLAIEEEIEEPSEDSVVL